jgi:sugar phosphate isomerase/epimerase
MRACLHSVSLPDQTVSGVLQKAKAAGYHGVELNAETLPWAEPHVTPDITEPQRKQIRQEAAKLGLPILALGAHIDMIEPDVEKRRCALQFVTGCSGPLAAECSAAEAWSWFSEAVAAASDHAVRRDITLGIEAIAGHLFCRTDHYHQLYKDLPGSKFSINFDPSHLIVQGENPMRVVDELGTRVAHVHMKDGAGHFPRFTFPPLGQGTIDFAAIVAGLRVAGFCGGMSLEYEAQVYGFELTDDDILSSGRSMMSRLGID